MRSLVVYRQLLRDTTVRHSDRITCSERLLDWIEIDDLNAIFR
jgi:hypothetical protein